MATYKFRLGADPMGTMAADAVLQRVGKVSIDYADHVLDGGDLNPAKVHVWVVALDGDRKCQFAPAKLLGYAPTVSAYLSLRRKGKSMTGVDAVTALRKRGFLDCASADFPVVERRFAKWISAMDAATRSDYRFMIHPRDIRRLRKPLESVCTAYAKLDSVEKEAFRRLVDANEV